MRPHEVSSADGVVVCQREALWLPCNLGGVAALVGDGTKSKEYAVLIEKEVLQSEMRLCSNMMVLQMSREISVSAKNLALAISMTS